MAGMWHRLVFYLSANISLRPLSVLKVDVQDSAEAIPLWKITRHYISAIYAKYFPPLQS
jgi:hypothetical protein